MARSDGPLGRDNAEDLRLAGLRMGRLMGMR